MKGSTLEQISQARDEGVACALVTRIGDGAQWLIHSDRCGDDVPGIEPGILQLALDAIRRDRSFLDESLGEPVFVQIFNRRQRLLVVGAVHVAQALVPMAVIAGFDVSVIDPRTAFASEARFPDTTLCHEWPDEALELLSPDVRTAVVTLTHDPKLDDPALSVALKSDAFYIGCLGSRRTHAARLDRLRELGFEGSALARIHAPVGLDIAAQSTAEIAVAVLAEVIQALRRNRT